MHRLRGVTIRLEPSDCPACGAAPASTIADRDGIRREIELLWTFHLRRLRDGVPVRHLADRVVFSQEPPLGVVRCDGCGTLYRNPRETPRSVDERYREETDAPDVLEALMRTQRGSERGRVRRLTRHVGGIGRGLEVGCYAGAFLAEATAAGWWFEGIDVNDDVVAHIRRHGLRARRGRVTDEAPGRRLDAVTFWTCLDQIADPRAAIRAAARLLRPGGVLAVRVPNGGFYRWLRRRLEGRLQGPARRLLAWNNLLGFPYLQAFTPASLRRLLADAALERATVHGDVLVPLSDRWTRAWAAAEERAIKAALRPLPAAASPWLEAYARAP